MVKDRKTVKAELERASFPSAGKLSLRCVVEGLLGEGLSDCRRPLHRQGVLVASGPHARRNGGELSAARCHYSSRIRKLPAGLRPGWGAHAAFKNWPSRFSRSDARRGGKVCVNTVRSSWSPYH